MGTITINNPIWIRNGIAFISLTDWTFRQYANRWGELEVEVYQDGAFMGRNKVVRKAWIKDCEYKEAKVKKRKDEPLTFFYGRMKLYSDEPLSVEYLAKLGVF